MSAMEEEKGEEKEEKEEEKGKLLTVYMIIIYIYIVSPRTFPFSSPPAYLETRSPHSVGRDYEKNMLSHFHRE